MDHIEHLSDEEVILTTAKSAKRGLRTFDRATAEELCHQLIKGLEVSTLAAVAGDYRDSKSATIATAAEAYAEAFQERFLDLAIRLYVARAVLAFASRELTHEQAFTDKVVALFNNVRESTKVTSELVRQLERSPVGSYYCAVLMRLSRADSLRSNVRSRLERRTYDQALKLAQLKKSLGEALDICLFTNVSSINPTSIVDTLPAKIAERLQTAKLGELQNAFDHLFAEIPGTPLPQDGPDREHYQQALELIAIELTRRGEPKLLAEYIMKAARALGKPMVVELEPGEHETNLTFDISGIEQIMRNVIEGAQPHVQESKTNTLSDLLTRAAITQDRDEQRMLLEQCYREGRDSGQFATALLALDGLDVITALEDRLGRGRNARRRGFIHKDWGEGIVRKCKKVKNPQQLSKMRSEAAGHLFEARSNFLQADVLFKLFLATGKSHEHDRRVTNLADVIQQVDRSMERLAPSSRHVGI